jgi:hypothetical protein
MRSNSPASEISIDGRWFDRACSSRRDGRSLRPLGNRRVGSQSRQTYRVAGIPKIGLLATARIRSVAADWARGPPAMSAATNLRIVSGALE